MSILFINVKTAVYKNVNGDIVGYTSKTAKIKKGDITQQHSDISDVLLGNNITFYDL